MDKTTESAETAYRAYVGHTITHADCGADGPCEKRRRLKDAWQSLCRRCAGCGTTSLPSLSVVGATIPLCDDCKPRQVR
ncbi:hypothetical protein [Streptomyces yanii]|uniref:hypothetical protein n=1 Tax=Streptomyces yanii TaxID=78510 RepID=UPI0031E9F811